MKRYDTSPPHVDPATPLSPLGALFRREARRLVARYPERPARLHVETILHQFVHIFEDVTAEELERAVREGSTAFSSPTGVDDQATISQIVAQAMAARRHTVIPPPSDE